MPSYNQARFIEASMRSVLEQDYPAIELVVADGGSTDGTLLCLEAMTAEFGRRRLRWLTENDDGPANALNKALHRARGTVIGWLNSDDLYTPGAVRRAVEALSEHPSWLMAYGHGEHVDEQGRGLGRYLSKPPSTPVREFSTGCFICQPTVFFQRTMYILLGSLDEGLKTAFDFDYWLRAFRAFPERIGFVNALQAQSRLHGECITLSMRRTVAMEGMQVLARHLGHAPRHWLTTYAEELLSGRASADGIEDIGAHLQASADEAAAWLTAGDVLQLREQFRQRLQRRAEAVQRERA